MADLTITDMDNFVTDALEGLSSMLQGLSDAITTEDFVTIGNAIQEIQDEFDVIVEHMTTL